MNPIPFLPQKGALQSHFLFVNLLARALDQHLKGKVISFVVSPSLTRIQFGFTQATNREVGQASDQLLSHGPPKQNTRVQARPETAPEAVLELNWSGQQPLLFWHPDGAPMPDAYEKQLFPTWGLQVKDVRGFTFDRWIEISLNNGGAVWIKWFGRNGNVLYHDGQQVHSVFRRSHQSDFQFMPSADGRIDGSAQNLPPAYAAKLQTIAFEQPEKFLFASAADFMHWWKNSGVLVESANSTSPPVLLPLIRQLPHGLPLLNGTTQFARQYAAFSSFQQLREASMGQLKKAEQAVRQKILRLEAELNGLLEAGDYRRQANSLLTFPNLILPNATQVCLPDCEDLNRSLNIRIDPALSIPENADRLFAKSKRQHLQRAHLQGQFDQKRLEYSHIQQAIELLVGVNDPKQWRKMGIKMNALKLPYEVLVAFRQKSKTETEAAARKAWLSYTVDGWEVWVGRDAQGNAELLRQAHKNDIWLHARGYAGSHVLIRSAGKVVSQELMRQAARLAAMHSKGRGEEVCAVSFTQRKYVRPVKGGPPGKVILDREEVIFSHRSDAAPSKA